MPREKSAGAIIYRLENGQPYYLLLHYGPGHWGFAKGHVEGQETEEETAIRETEEETGIKDLIIIPGFKKIEKYFFRQYQDNVSEKDKKKGKTTWVFKLVVFFLAETKTINIKLSHEHKGFIWLSIKEAIKKTTFKNSKKLLKEAHEYLSEKQIIKNGA